MRSLLIGLLLIGSSALWAKHSIEHEIDANTAASITLGLKVPETILGAAVGYSHAFHRNIQFGGSVSFTGAGSLFTLAGLAGPTFNFGGEDLREDFFFQAMAGIYYVSLAPLTSFMIEAKIGKRFKILSNVSYKPFVELQYPTQSNPLLVIVPFSLSVLF